uniref:Deoxynucleoside kinase domain-containing protein n=1 Tax=viral metagenome TaxID=1070528 RepID=A0A6C0CTK4_9ZZZZ
MTIITIDGNIGAGKSTLLKYIESHTNYLIDLEPVEIWEPFLIDMYQNNKDAFEFQVKVWLDRCYASKYSNNKITCVERSPHFQWNVFSKANYENHKLNDRQIELIGELYKKPCYIPDIYIYLKSDPTKCMERIHYRHRDCENAINISYIQNLHHLHEEAYERLHHLFKVEIDIENKSIEEIGIEVIYIIDILLHTRTKACVV